MAIARFGEIPLVTDEFDRQSVAWPYVGRRQFRILKNYFERLPASVKLLFSLNIQQIVFRDIPSEKIFYSPMAELIYHWRRKEKPFIVFYPLGRHCREIYKIFVHELGHSLDPAVAAKAGFRPGNHFPAWAIKAADSKNWKKILRVEPISAEQSDSDEDDAKKYFRRPEEQWASRFALTAAIDYLAPAGLVSQSNLSPFRRISAARFRSGWPQSYRFFHEYIRRILARAPKN